MDFDREAQKPMTVTKNLEAQHHGGNFYVNYFKKNQILTMWDYGILEQSSLGRPKNLCFFGKSPKARDRPAALGMSQHRGG